MSKILAVIVTYNGAEWLRYCLQPFVEKREGIDVMVVDNASTDHTVELIHRHYPFVEVVERQANGGFGNANNIAMEQALVRGYQGVMLINQDAQCSTQVIETLAERTTLDPTIGIASPLHYNDLSYTQLDRAFRSYDIPSHTSAAFTPTPFINAALWYIPRQTLERVGIFCPLFFHYGEDLDYCHRVVAEGLQVGFYPDLQAAHLRPDAPPSADKQKRLSFAFHLAEMTHPSLPSWKRIWRGVGLSMANALIKWNSGYLHNAHTLWRMRYEIRLWNKRPAPDVEGLQRCLERRTEAPVLLLVYNRPQHTAQLLQDLFLQPEAEATPIFILSDGAKSEADREAVEQVREICRHYLGPHLQLREQATNVGLAHNVVAGIQWVLQRYDRIIVLEDDLRLAPYCLRWMNDALDCYERDSSVAHIHAGSFYTHPWLPKLPNNHRLSFVGSWGWGTWRNRWQRYWEPSGEKLLEQMKRSPEVMALFDHGGAMPFSRMLRKQVIGENDSWAVRWHASLLLHQKVSINAYPPLVTNTGFDGTGTHSGGGGRYHTALAPYPLYAKASSAATQEMHGYDPIAQRHLQRYYRYFNSKLVKGYYKLRELLHL